MGVVYRALVPACNGWRDQGFTGRYGRPERRRHFLHEARGVGARHPQHYSHLRHRLIDGLDFIVMGTCRGRTAEKCLNG
jgi:hypothetical protein